MSIKPDHNRTPSVQLKIEASGGPPNGQFRRSWTTLVRRNASFIGQQLVTVVGRSSPVVQTVSMTLLAFYLLQLTADGLFDTLTLSPGQVISPGQWVWSVIGAITHPFVEERLWHVAVDVVVVSLAGTLIEPLWGHRELMTFMVGINLLSALLAVVTYVLMFTITSDAGFLFGVRIHGLGAFCGAVSVAVKQLMPQSVLLTTAIGRVKNDHVPLTSFAVAVLLYLVNGISGAKVVVFGYGLLLAWAYLRFWQPHNNGQRHGDSSDQMAFQTLFPNVVQPAVAIVADGVYSALVRVGCCRPVHEHGQYQTYRALSERLTHDHLTQNSNATSVSVANHSKEASVRPKVEVL